MSAEFTSGRPLESAIERDMFFREHGYVAGIVGARALHGSEPFPGTGLATITELPVVVTTEPVDTLAS